MKRALLVLGFVAITIALTFLWEESGRVTYGRFLKAVAPPIYDLFGVGDARVGAFRQRYINWVPFVGLMLVTPGLAWRRRLGGLAGGLVLLFAGHLALNLTERVHKAAQLPFVPSLVSDALPFLLWVLFAWPVVSRWFASALAEIPPAAQDESRADDPSDHPIEPGDPS
ncbi:MAG: hypothetical protein CL931_02440 [Deltaproteobacteria bacterium]|nr:hypothetical protein [Deltaproteobacteria bacterium]